MSKRTNFKVFDIVRTEYEGFYKGVFKKGIGYGIVIAVAGTEAKVRWFDEEHNPNKVAWFEPNELEIVNNVSDMIAKEMSVYN